MQCVNGLLVLAFTISVSMAAMENDQLKEEIKLPQISEEMTNIDRVIELKDGKANSIDLDVNITLKLERFHRTLRCCFMLNPIYHMTQQVLSGYQINRSHPLILISHKSFNAKLKCNPNGIQGKLIIDI